MNDKPIATEDGKASKPRIVATYAANVRARPHPFKDWLRDAARSELLPLHLTWIFTLGLAIFAAIAWREATHSTTALEGQLEVLHEEQRPWLYPAKASVHNDEGGEGSKLILVDGLLLFTGHMSIKNVGKTPGYNVGIKAILAYDEAHADFTACEKKTPNAKGYDSVVIPSQDTDFVWTAYQTKENKEDWEKKGIKKGAFHIYGCILYTFKDEKGLPNHKTSFVYTLMINDRQAAFENSRWMASELKIDGVTLKPLPLLKHLAD